MTLDKKLYEIQQNLKAPKAQYNSFAKYKFRSCEDIVEAVKPLLPEDTYLTLSDQIQIFGNHLYVVATATITWAGLSVSTTGCARETLDKKGMDSGQMTGTASSYARKYALNGLFAIDDTKDADTTEHKQDSDAKASKAPNLPKAELTPEQKKTAARATADKIILEYKACKGLTAMSDVQAKHKDNLAAFQDRYSDLDKEINTVVLQVIASFDQ